MYSPEVPLNAHRVLKQQGQLVTIAGDKQKNFDVEELISRGWQIVHRKSAGLMGGNGYHMITTNSNYQVRCVHTALKIQKQNKKPPKK